MGIVFVGLGACLLSLAWWGLWADVRWIAQPFYAYAWWGYILMLDGVCVLRRGHSILTARRRFILPICLWSVTFWFFFELLNVRFQNWYYVGVFPGTHWAYRLFGAVFTLLAFATVFMGIFQTYEALTALGLFRRWRGKPGWLHGWVSYAVQGVGLVMAGLAIGFPFYLAPLIWGSFTFLIDPWNYRRGARSILRDLEARHWGAVARLLIAGLICGFVWESFNFFAPQKWIYTVRGLEKFKLFEMPLPGFLGFPALAFDCVTAFAFLSFWFLGNKTWEHHADLAYVVLPRRVAPPVVAVTWVPVQVVFWVVVAFAGTPYSVASLQLELEDYLDPREVHILREAGIDRPRQLLRTLNDAHGAVSTQRRLGWTDQRRLEVMDQTRLYTFKGIGTRHGQLLRQVGVRRPEDLFGQDPSDLHRQLVVAADRCAMVPPRLDMVRVWVFATHNQGIVQRVSWRADER